MVLFVKCSDSRVTMFAFNRSDRFSIPISFCGSFLTKCSIMSFQSDLDLEEIHIHLVFLQKITIKSETHFALDWGTLYRR
jgi:hypothetical protein